MPNAVDYLGQGYWLPAFWGQDGPTPGEGPYWPPGYFGTTYWGAFFYADAAPPPPPPPVIFAGASVPAAAQAFWAGTPAMASLTGSGRLWYRKVPEGGDVLPYAMFFQVSSAPETWTTRYPFERTILQFNFHAATAAQAEALGESFRLAFRGAPLFVGSSPVCHVLPDGTTLEEGEGLAPGGRDCWVAAETFDIAWTP